MLKYITRKYTTKRSKLWGRLEGPSVSRKRIFRGFPGAMSISVLYFRAECPRRGALRVADLLFHRGNGGLVRAHLPLHEGLVQLAHRQAPERHEISINFDVPIKLIQIEMLDKLVMVIHNFN